MIGSDGVTHFGEALKTNKTLTILNLESVNKMEHVHQKFAMKQITPPFENSNSTDNVIDESGATSLSEGLKSNSTLTELILCGKYKTVFH